MAFGEQCEECRRTPADFNMDAPPFDDSPFDYCSLCSEDLCPDCFKHPCYGVIVTGEKLAEHHQPSEVE